MITTLLPFSGRPPETAFIPSSSWRTIDCSGDDYAYARALAEQWRKPGSILIVEHDIVPSIAILQSLVNCPYQWCAAQYAYPDRAAPVAGLGCVRFDAKLVYATADIADDLPRLRWGQLDDYIARVLTRRGYARHLHGFVEHRRAA